MTPEAAPAAADAPLSLDDAVSLMSADAPDEQQAPEITQSEAEPTAEDEIEAEEPIELEPEDEPEQDESPAIAAPSSWDAEGRAVFATLPREAQQTIVAREAAREAYVTKATTEAANARKAAETEVQALGQLKDQTQAALEKALPLFKGKWDHMTPERWSQWAAEDPGACFAAREMFNAEQQALAEMAQTAQQQVLREKQAFNQQKVEDLKTIAPHLLDPVKGPERVRELESYIIAETGIDRSFLETLDAKVINIALKAMKYDQAVARAKTKTPVKQSAPVRPAAAPVAASSPKRAAEAARNRFAQTGSIDDAVALMTARQ